MYFQKFRQKFPQIVCCLNLDSKPPTPSSARMSLNIFCMNPRKDFHKFANSLNLEHPLLPMLERVIFQGLNIFCMSSRNDFHSLNLEHPLLPLLERVIFQSLNIFCMISRKDFHIFANSLEHPLLPMLPRRPLVDHILHHPPPTQQLLNKTFLFSFNSSKLFLQHLLENRY